MTSPSTSGEENRFSVRFAKPSDARTISQLYVRIYTPEGGGSAQEHYPFPQIMDQDQVAQLILGGTVFWVVAEAQNGAVIGSAAAVRNIGAPMDRIAEIFGVAVDIDWQRQGVGSALLQHLQVELTRAADFVLCEARTAEAGGWKAARNAGLRPVGFEPYAHAMPIGFESMVLTASWSLSRHQEPREISLYEYTEAVQRIAETVCPYPMSALSAQAEGRRLFLRRSWPAVSQLDPLVIRRDDTYGNLLYSGSVGRQSSIVEFCPLKGEEPSGQRFEDACYVASTGESDVAAARVFCDHIDGRARILGVRASMGGIEAQLLDSIVEDLQRHYKGKPLVVITCVRAAAKITQMSLESAGFFPTAYFPEMIYAPAGREDVIQYTRLFGRSLADSTRSVTALDWPEARRIIEEVTLAPSL